MLSADKLPQGLFHPFPILLKVIHLYLNGNLVTRKQDISDIIFVADSFSVGEKIHGLQDLFFNPHFAEIFDREIGILHNIMQESGLLFQLIFSHQSHSKHVQDSRISFQILLAVMGIDGNPDDFINGSHITILGITMAKILSKCVRF